MADELLMTQHAYRGWLLEIRASKMTTYRDFSRLNFLSSLNGRDGWPRPHFKHIVQVAKLYAEPRQAPAMQRVVAGAQARLMKTPLVAANQPHSMGR
jgi:hypothetical protein